MGGESSSGGPGGGLPPSNEREELRPFRTLSNARKDEGDKRRIKQNKRRIKTL